MSIHNWSILYNYFAKELLSYKNNRGRLIEAIKEVFAETGLKLPRLDESDNIIDIDPFTVFGLFNRDGVSGNKRDKIFVTLSEKLGITISPPNDYSGIPILNSQNATFYGFGKDRKETDIDDLWILFEEALNYAESNESEPSQKLIASFDKAMTIKWVGNAKITMGLFWIAPEKYLNLDQNNVWYIYKSGKLQKGALHTVPEMEEKLSAYTYFCILKEVSRLLQNNSDGIENFIDLSFEAWNSWKKKKREIKEAKKLREQSQAFLLQPDEESFDWFATENNPKEKNYWWLNANPKYWSFSEIAIGEVQDYTLYSDTGHKRRIFQNFLDAKEGDIVIGYESYPTKKITAIARISQAQDGECLYFQKIETLKNPIDLSVFKNAKELSQMECFINPQGSLFKLTEDEFDFLMDIIREENPIENEKKIQCYNEQDFLSEVFISSEKYNSLARMLKAKKNIILQGAPGVGKTFAARRLAYSIMGVKDDSRIEFVQFHQNYSYEDFVMGYKPNENGFELKNGIFYSFCQKAASEPEKDYFFIIDEINRGNMSKIFGELLMLIEKDYRGTALTLAYNGLPFRVPKNLHIIGMMNTADRSLAMIDYALRRRFSFFDMEPGFDSEGFMKYQQDLNNEKLDKLVSELKSLNNAIIEDKSLGKGFCIGHSYLCGETICTDEWLQGIVQYDILPMLAEYWFDDIEQYNSWEKRLTDAVK